MENGKDTRDTDVDKTMSKKSSKLFLATTIASKIPLSFIPGHHHCTSSTAVHYPLPPWSTLFFIIYSFPDQTQMQGQGLAQAFHVPADDEHACALLLLIKPNEHSVWFEPSNQTDPANRNTITSTTIRVNPPFFSSSPDSSTLRSLRPSFVSRPTPLSPFFFFFFFFLRARQTMLKPELISLWKIGNERKERGERERRNDIHRPCDNSAPILTF